MPLERLIGECWRKQRYYRQQNANKAAARAFLERGVLLRVYMCEHCGRYHLTKELTRK